jgi:hypothetical protein
VTTLDANEVDRGGNNNNNNVGGGGGLESGVIGAIVGGSLCCLLILIAIVVAVCLSRRRADAAKRDSVQEYLDDAPVDDAAPVSTLAPDPGITAGMFDDDSEDTELEIVFVDATAKDVASARKSGPAGQSEIIYSKLPDKKE